jgi:hypothetical protein
MAPPQEGVFLVCDPASSMAGRWLLSASSGGRFRPAPRFRRSPASLFASRRWAPRAPGARAAAGAHA